MRKLKFVGLFIGLGIMGSAAMAGGEWCLVTPTHDAAPGSSACRGPSYNPPNNLTVQTCNGNTGQWQNSGQSCTCSEPYSFAGPLNGIYTCTVSYKTS